MIRLWAAVAMCGAMIALGAAPAPALDPALPLTQYGYRSWQSDTGLPQNTVHAIAQGPDGFLWIATEGGLVRFDGVQFEVLTRANTPGLPSDVIDDLMVDASGTLWISTSGGLARMRNGQLEAFGPKQGIPATQVWRAWQAPRLPGGTGRQDVWVLSAAGLFRIADDAAVRIPLAQDLTESSRMATTSDGSLWLSTAEGVVRAEFGGAFRAAGAASEATSMAVDGSGRVWAGLRSGLEVCSVFACHGVPLPGGSAVNALAADASGRMWIGADGGLFVQNGETVKPFRGQPGYLGSSRPNFGRVDFLFCDAQGMLWAGISKGLLRIEPAKGSAELLRGGDVYLAASEDREGDLWLGTESGGLAVLRNRTFSTLTAQDGLSENYVLALAQSPAGGVWIATKGGGLNRFQDGHLTALTTAQGLASNVVLAVATAANGDLWAGTPDGLNLTHDGRVRVFTSADGLADDFVRSLYLDRTGALWIGTRHGVSRYENGAFTTWTAIDGLGSDLIGAMSEDSSGALWVGTLGGLSGFRDGRWTNFTTKNGLSSNVITALFDDGAGTLWIGTNDGGLNRMRGGRIVPVAARALPARILGILDDGAGYLWLSSNSGIYRVRRDGLNRAADGGPAPEVTRYGVADGMAISECSSGGHPAALRLRDGTLWFATLKGVARVDPEHIPVDEVPPKVAIERVSVDDRPEALRPRLTIGPGHSHYEFDYAGLTFVAPQKVEYRYRLEGFDGGWVDVGTRRMAYYTNLPHGRYTFRVMARNSDGVWSTQAATQQLTIEPHLWQTWDFRLLVLATVAGMGYVAWRRRLQRAEREFQAVLGERTRIAREIHDTLAQGFVAVSVQMELIAQLMQVSAEAAREQLDRARALVRSSLEDARTSIWELRSQSADHEDLAARMLQLAEEAVSRAGGTSRLQMQVGGTYRPLDGGIERELLRIAREAVVNAVRHGDPKTILLRLEYEGSVFAMEIRDDGKGFAGNPPDGASGHYGLTGMRERAEAIGATFQVESQAGAGTSVRLRLSLSRAAEAGK